jgi:hypothetical protein
MAPGFTPPRKRLHYQVIPLPQLDEEHIQIREVVTVVGVAHDAEAAAGSQARLMQRDSITALWYVDNPGPKFARNLL